jgi:cardiolipin synthase
LADYLPHFTLFALLELAVIVIVIPWVLITKKDSAAAVAWCLVVILMPLIGVVLFWVFGYHHVHRPLRRRRKHRQVFQQVHPPEKREATRGLAQDAESDPTYQKLGSLALRLGGFPISHGNQIRIFDEPEQTYKAMCEAIQEARHHIHLEYYLVQSDETGQAFLELLARKAREGVQVRFLYDYIGGIRLRRRLVKLLEKAQGKVAVFMPLNPWRRRLQVNLRNHRKILVVDGRLALTGGMNIGNEYLGKDPSIGHWRDTDIRLEGPVVSGLQRVFIEDWDFAYQEDLDGPEYFPELPLRGEGVVQILDSGPDQEIKCIREVYFAAILSARERLWIATPYFVPDSGILDAIRLAGYRGVDVRILTPWHPDHFMTYYAAGYYWPDLLAAGVKVYHYTRGMMHAKVMTVDGKWGAVGTANLDNRSLHLNFEVNCILYSAEQVVELEESFRKDLRESIQLDADVFAARPFSVRLMENACRLLAPIL